MASRPHSSRDPAGRKSPDEPSPRWKVSAELIIAALCGEITLHDDDLLLILACQPTPARAKSLCVGLNAHRLITDDQTALAFYALPLKEA